MEAGSSLEGFFKRARIVKRRSVVIVPDDSEGTRSFQLTPRTLRIGGALLTAGLLSLGVILASWWYFAAEAARVPELEREISRLQEENAKVKELGAAVAKLQEQSDRIRSMLGADVLTSGGTPDIPPGDQPGAVELASGSTTGLSPQIPTSWPLSASGFVTREHATDELQASGGHPGLDIAVAQDTYIRASGSGIVREAASDTVYGLYVLIDHGNTGYSSMYGHASRLFVTSGDSVRQNQVIALSGNTGRSTAPHLHFEIRQDDQPVDPYTLVQPRSGS